MVGHLFSRIYADVVLQYSDIPSRDGTFSSTLGCTEGVLHVLSVASGTQDR